MNYDLINGTFELISGLSQIVNIRKLIKDKEVKGIAIWPVIFFISWGVWNLFYYPYLGQIISFIGGLLIVITNLIWLFLWYYYKQRKQKTFGKN